MRTHTIVSPLYKEYSNRDGNVSSNTFYTPRWEARLLRLTLTAALRREVARIVSRGSQDVFSASAAAQGGLWKSPLAWSSRRCEDARVVSHGSQDVYSASAKDQNPVKDIWSDSVQTWMKGQHPEKDSWPE